MSILLVILSIVLIIKLYGIADKGKFRLGMFISVIMSMVMLFMTLTASHWGWAVLFGFFTGTYLFSSWQYHQKAEIKRAVLNILKQQELDRANKD